MTPPTPLETEVARVVGRANMLMSVGQSGVMALNPAHLDKMFEDGWNGTTPAHQAARDYCYFVAKAVLRMPHFGNAVSLEPAAKPVIDLSSAADA